MPASDFGQDHGFFGGYIFSNDTHSSSIKMLLSIMLRVYPAMPFIHRGFILNQEILPSPSSSLSDPFDCD